MNLSFPEAREFAFTVLDDTDDTTTENGPPVYELLRELGLRTTKTVWMVDSPPERQGPYFAGQTLENEAYACWIDELYLEGFEIAFHNASMGSSERAITIRALDEMERRFPGAPTIHCNHGQNRENLYWGRHRYSLAPFRLVSGLRPGPPMDGHLEDSPFFWGDVAKERLRYIRAFAYTRLDCSTIVPGRPFRDPRRPYGSLWFNTTDAPTVVEFNRVVTPAALDRLRRSGGWAIVSTHFGKGFSREGTLDQQFERTMRYLAGLPGWFVPATQLLDHLVVQGGAHLLTAGERFRMELSHIVDRVVDRVRP